MVLKPSSLENNIAERIQKHKTAPYLVEAVCYSNGNRADQQMIHHELIQIGITDPPGELSRAACQRRMIQRRGCLFLKIFTSLGRAWGTGQEMPSTLA